MYQIVRCIRYHGKPKEKVMCELPTARVKCEVIFTHLRSYLIYNQTCIEEMEAREKYNEICMIYVETLINELDYISHRLKKNLRNL